VGKISSYPVITEMPPGSAFLVDQYPITGSNATSIITKQNVLPLYDARDYGVVANGVTDTTSALNTAISTVAGSGGGTLVLPSGTLITSAAIIGAPSVSLLGNGPQATIISQTSTTANGLSLSSSGVVSAGFSIEKIGFTGPGSGTGDGIHFAGEPFAYLSMRDVNVQDFGGTGVHIEGPIVATLERIVSTTNGVHGFWIDGTSSFVTSTSLIDCYGNDNPSAGYYIYKATYCSMTGCAADSNGIGYLLSDVFSFSATGCGAESSQSHSVSGYPGVSWKIIGDNTYGTGSVSLSGCFSYDVHDIGYWITGFSTGVALNACIDSTPHGGASYSLQVDTDATASGIACSFAGASDITGAYVTLSDSANSYSYLREVYANGVTLSDNPNDLAASQSSLFITASGGTNYIESVGTDDSGAAALTIGSQFIGTEYLSFATSGAATFPNAVNMSSTAAITTSLSIDSGTALTTTNQTGTGSLVLATNPSMTGATLGGTSFLTTAQVYGNLTMESTTEVILTDGVNIAAGTTTGTKIGTATSQKIGFYNVTPVIQYDTAGTTTGFTASTGTTVVSGSTFTGNTGSTAYTIGDIVLALKKIGIMTA
jgi:hypothetical protein